MPESNTCEIRRKCEPPASRRNWGPKQRTERFMITGGPPPEENLRDRSDALSETTNPQNTRPGNLPVFFIPTIVTHIPFSSGFAILAVSPLNSSFIMSEQMPPSPIERKKAKAIGEDTANKLINQVEELLDRGGGRFHDPEDHAEAKRMLHTARLLAVNKPQVRQEIDRLSASIEDIHK